MQIKATAAHASSKLATLFIFLLGAGTTALHAQAAAAAAVQSRFPLLPGTIVDALQKAGLQVNAGQVHIPAPLLARTLLPALDVTAAERLGEGALRVRLNCRVAGECLPFFVVVDLPSSAAGLAAIPALHASPTAPQPVGESSGTTLRAGARTMLLLEDNHMRISLPVITLESGAVGSEVRVSSLDRKTTFRAIVETSQTVRGSLP